LCGPDSITLVTNYGSELSPVAYTVGMSAP